LPEIPTGWTKRLTMHMSFARHRGMGQYIVFNEKGEEMPIGWQYDTRDDGETGFFIIGREKCSPVVSWPVLRTIWPRFLEKRAAAVRCFQCGQSLAIDRANLGLQVEPICPECFLANAEKETTAFGGVAIGGQMIPTGPYAVPEQMLEYIRGIVRRKKFTTAVAGN